MPAFGWMIPLMLLVTPSLVAAPADPPRPPSAMQVTIRQAVRSNAAFQPLQVKRLSVRVDVASDLAETTLDFQVDNPNPWVVEGELALPLGEDQNVASFALDMNGKLRNASVVDRAKAEAAYTSIVRRGVDPGILDRAGANLYRIRIFPIPALGSRQVRVGLVQALRPLPDGSLLTMPLALDGTALQGALEVRILSGGQAPELQTSPLPGLAFVQEGATWVARKEGANLTFAGTLGIRLSLAPEAGSAWVGQDRGLTYAYAHVRLPAVDEAKPLRDRILLAWDCSVSGQERDREREWAAVEDYLKGQPDVELQVWAFNRTVFERRTFRRAGRELDKVKAYVLALPADGTCDLGALDFTGSQAQEIILCTPGLTRLFKGEPRTGTAPIQVLVSSIKADIVRLRALARRTGGEAFDLNLRSRAEVRRLLRRLPFQFLKAEVLEGEVQNLVPSHPRPVRGGLGLACVLAGPKARLRLSFGRAGKAEIVREIAFSTEGAHPSPTPRRLWATAKLEEMEEDEEVMPKGRGPLAALAMEHGLVTRDTSLLVLETLADYRRYGVAIPEDLRPQDVANPAPPVQPAKASAARAKEKVEEEVSEDLEAWLMGRARWWSQPFRAGVPRAKDQGFVPARVQAAPIDPEAPPPPPPPAPAPSEKFSWNVWCVGIHTLPALGYPGGVAGGDEDLTFRPGQRRASLLRELNGRPKEVMTLGYAVPEMAGSSLPGGAPMGMPVIGSVSDPATGSAILPGPNAAPAPTFADDPTLPQAWPDLAATPEVRTPRHWRLGAERVQALAKASPEEKWQLYLRYKEKYCQSLGFILDCARILAQGGRRDLALGIATNLAEPQKIGPGEQGSDEFPRLLALGDLLWELGDLEGASVALREAQNADPADRVLLLRRARLARLGYHTTEALDLFRKASETVPGQEAFDTLQGVAWEERGACRIRQGRPVQGKDAPLAWGLRIEVENVFGLLPEGAVSVVDPRGERVWHEMPLGTEGLGLDDASQDLNVFMARKASRGTYRVEVRPDLFQGDDHVPDEVRVTVTYGFGSANPRVRTFRGRLTHFADVWVVATFPGEPPAGIEPSRKASEKATEKQQPRTAGH